MINFGKQKFEVQLKEIHVVVEGVQLLLPCWSVPPVGPAADFCRLTNIFSPSVKFKK